jgi:hypothetical protein
MIIRVLCFLEELQINQNGIKLYDKGALYGTLFLPILWNVYYLLRLMILVRGEPE